MRKVVSNVLSVFVSLSQAPSAMAPQAAGARGLAPNLFASLVPLPQNSVIARRRQFFINKSEKFNVGVKWCVEYKYKIWVGNVLIYKL